MNPIDVANRLRNQYISYLTTTFGLSEGVTQLSDRFAELLSEPGQLLAGPFLEATAPYLPGEQTLQRLVTEELLDTLFTQLFASPEQQKTAQAQAAPSGFGLRKAGGSAPKQQTATRRRERFPRDRVLYRHQEQAIHRLCRDTNQHEVDRHTVVASGTGSGKTECFLIPSIDWILRPPTRSKNGDSVGRGIRVLLVYPMNALVNDQVRRLTQLVGYWPKRGDKSIPITFARYTSETAKTRVQGLEREPHAPANQLLGRDEIIQNPPDLLITNFAMLEQALLRPQESPFFDDVDEFAWRFLILDEAHSYRGAQGIELARLMQRVRAAVRRGKENRKLTVHDPICIATSATLAGENMSVEERRKKTAEFAGALFGLEFDEAGVIFAERLDPAKDADRWEFSDGDTERNADAAWASIPPTCLSDLDLPADPEFWNAFQGVAPLNVWNDAKAIANDDRRAFLYHLLRGHPRFHWLWNRVREAPQQFERLSAEWASDEHEDYSSHLERLVASCNASRRCAGEQALLPCRYHLFASALEGLFVDLASDQEQAAPHLDWDLQSLGIRRVATRRLKPDDRIAFEVSHCRNCRYPFLSVDLAPQAQGLDQPPIWNRPVQFLTFSADCSDGSPLDAVRVDLRNGQLDGSTSPGTPIWRTLYRVPGSSDHTDVQTCPHCGYDHRHHRVAGRFQTGQDAPVSVLTESLYSQLPELTPLQRDELQSDFGHRFGVADDPMVGGGRKLLATSDNAETNTADGEESFPSAESSTRVAGSYLSGRSLIVLNLGDFTTDRHGISRRQGFKLCGRCGRVHFDRRDTERRHRPPYHNRGQACRGPIGLGGNTQGQSVALGHRYETDVIWLEFHGTGKSRTNTGFWLSLAYALTNAACRELNIERADLEATTVPLEDQSDRHAIVIYDSVPGGAGHCRQILHSLPKVIRRAQALLAGCDCDPDSTGCYGCLCDYQNQFAHEELSRGAPLKYLGELVDALDSGHPSPWRDASASPGREMVDSLMSATGSVSLVTNEILPGTIRGLNRDWFDIFKQLAARPCGPDKLKLVVARIPSAGSEATNTLAYHRIAELKSLGVAVESFDAKDRQASALTIQQSDAQVHAVWKWPWTDALGPDVDSVCRSRLGREQEAISTLEPAPASKPIALPKLREFNEFTLEPGKRHNLFSPKLLGSLLRHFVAGAVVIDPHILHSTQQVGVLEDFLRLLKVTDSAQVKVKAGRVRRDERRGNFTRWSEQDTAANDLTKRFKTHNLEVVFPDDGYFVDHDRVIYLELEQQDGFRYYKVILGQGLFGFHSGCRRRSHGVWFEASEDEWRSEYNKN